MSLLLSLICVRWTIIFLEGTSKFLVLSSLRWCSWKLAMPNSRCLEVLGAFAHSAKVQLPAVGAELPKVGNWANPANWLVNFANTWRKTLNQTQPSFFWQAIYMILWLYSRREKPCCHWATIAFESSDMFLALLCPKHWKVISHIGRTPDAGHYVYYNRHDMLFDQLGTRFCISIWKQSRQKTVHWFFILFTPLCCDKASCPQICFAGLRLVFGYVTMMTNASRFQPDFNVVGSKVSFARCIVLQVETSEVLSSQADSCFRSTRWEITVPLSSQAYLGLYARSTAVAYSHQHFYNNKEG